MSTCEQTAVAGEHRLAVGHEPAVEVTLLRGGGVEMMTRVDTTTGRAESGDAQLGAVVVGE